MDSPERDSEAIPTLEGAAQEASREVSKVLEDGVPAKGPFDTDRVARETPSEIAGGPLFSARLANASPERARLPNRMVLGSYVPLQECGRPLLDMVAPSPEVVREIINRWSPFHKGES